MNVLSVRNVHQALPLALRWLKINGIKRDSRNGPVLLAPGPFTTEYQRPTERLTFWEQRDANPAFLLVESLWMLAGRNDLPTLTRYVSTFGNYSDDGKTLHGAYGYRWRQAFGFDQLRVIAERLRVNPEDRRCVLQMWDAPRDLGNNGRDVPCNDMATFQRNASGALDMVVFNRSNDAIWGAYFANAAHFSVLQEYLAMWIGCPVGRYWQVSSNFHAYQEVLATLDGLPAEALDSVFTVVRKIDDPYETGNVRSVPLASAGDGPDAIEDFDQRAEGLLLWTATGLEQQHDDSHPWFNSAYAVLRAHHAWRNRQAPERFISAHACLDRADQTSDWVRSMRMWLKRRELAWLKKQEVTA